MVWGVLDMLKAQLFHANALDKLPKVHEQLNEFLSRLDDDAIVEMAATEFGPSAGHEFFSYTVLLIYKSNA